LHMIAKPLPWSMPMRGIDPIFFITEWLRFTS